MTPYYEDEYATIYHGDCREVLPTVSASAEMVVSDPPYGVRYTGGTKEWTAIEGDEDFGAYGFVLPLLKPVDGPLYLFCPDVALPSVVETAGGWLRSVIVWRKPAQYGARSAHYKQANEFLCYMVRPGAKSRWAGITDGDDRLGARTPHQKHTPNREAVGGVRTGHRQPCSGHRPRPLHGLRHHPRRRQEPRPEVHRNRN